MPIEPILALIIVAVLANLIVMVALVVSPILDRRHRDAASGGRGSDPAVTAQALGGRTYEDLTAADDAGTYDRVVRIVSWSVILAAGVIVLATGLWPEDQTAILVLLAAAALFVLVVHDLIPEGTLGPAKFVVEGSVAITAATLLVALTDGVASPFFFVYPLIVGGAALVVPPRITVALTAIAAGGYVLAVAVGSSPEALVDPSVAAIVGINLTAMILLAYIAMVIAREQRRARDAAIRLSTIDPLTGLFNRGFFFAAIEREIARSARSGRGFCLLMMDLDELKTVNDRFGHFHGDRVLRAVGEVVTSDVRRIDTAARYGGDEFVVLLPETDPTGAYVVAEKIRQSVAALELDLPDPAIRPSLSIGVVDYPDDGRTPDELMISADGAMYASKRSGKNRVTGVRLPEPVPGSGVASGRA